VVKTLTDSTASRWAPG